MALSYELISQFAKLATGDKKTSTEATVYGTVMVDENGNKYVKLDGSDQLTPLTDNEQPSLDSSSTNANAGDRVSVLIKNHTATVTGNITPSGRSARTEDVEDLGDQVSEIKKFDILVGEQLQAQEGYIKQLQTDKASVGELDAATAKITYLETEKASIEELEAAKAEITDLVADKLDVEVADMKYATIEELEVLDGDIVNLNTDYLEVDKKLTTAEANITTLRTTIFDAESGEIKFATIDFANIGEAAFDKLFGQSGMFDNLTYSNGTVTGTLVGVTIKGDIIEGGTIIAEKLVIQGEDGLYYKLNTNGVTTTAEQTEYNSLNGSVITAKSVTAEKVNVDDLVAFGATIGGFVITNHSIYSGVKDSVDNSTRGMYLDKEGQMSVGDANNYLRYYLSTQWHYKIDGNNTRIDLTDQIDHSASTKVEGAVSEDGYDIYSGSLDDGSEVYYEYKTIEGSVYCTEIEKIEAYKLEISADSILFGANSKTSGDDLKKLTEHVKIGTWTDYTFKIVDGAMVVGLTTDFVEIIKINDNLIPPGCTGVYLGKRADGTEAYFTKIFEDATWAVELDVDTSPSVELAEGDTTFRQVITNKKTMFMDGDVPNTVIDTDGVSTDNLSVDKDLRHNNPDKTGSYAWAFRANGNYGLSWKEDTIS